MPTPRRRVTPAAEPITVLVSPVNKKKLLALIELLHLGKVETLEEKVARFKRYAPKNVPLTDEDIAEEVEAVRAARRNGH